MSEFGNRAEFLGRLRVALSGGVPENPAHPLPPAGGAVPEIRFTSLDSTDLPAAFVGAAQYVAARPTRMPALTAEFLAAFIEEEKVRTAVVSREPEARAAGAILAELGVAVSDYSREAALGADLGVTSAVFGIAATGSVVQDSSATGGRAVSLLPRVHLCVLPAERLVATPGDVLRSLGARTLPSNLVFITGPSRSGDIEQIITMGVHGPTSVHIALIEG